MNRLSIANISGRPLEIDGLSLAAGERIDDLENISDAAREAERIGEVQILPTPRVEQPQAQNINFGPAVETPTPVEKQELDGVLVNPNNPDAGEFEGDAGEFEGQRQDPYGAAVSSTAQQDVSISNVDLPGSVAGAEHKDPISKEAGDGPSSFAEFSATVDEKTAENAEPVETETDLASGVRKPRR